MILLARLWKGACVLGCALLLTTCGSDPEDPPPREIHNPSSTQPSSSPSETGTSSPSSPSEPTSQTPTDAPLNPYAFNQEKYTAFKALFEKHPPFETQFSYHAGDAWIFESIEGATEDDSGEKVYLFHDIQTNHITLTSDIPGRPAGMHYALLGLGVFSIDFQVTPESHLMANNWVTLIYKHDEKQQNYYLDARESYQEFFTLDSMVASHTEQGSTIQRQDDNQFEIHLVGKNKRYVNLSLGAYTADNRITILMKTRYKTTSVYTKITLIRESQAGIDHPVYYPLTRDEFLFASQHLAQTRISDLSLIMDIDPYHNQEFKLAANNLGLLDLSTDGMAAIPTERKKLLDSLPESTATFNSIPFLFLAYQFELGDLACENPLCPAVQPMAAYGSETDKHYLVFNKDQLDFSKPKNAAKYGIGTPVLIALDQAYQDKTSKLYTDFSKCLVTPTLLPNEALVLLTLVVINSYFTFWNDYLKAQPSSSGKNTPLFSIKDAILDGSFGTHITQKYPTELKAATGKPSWADLSSDCQVTLAERILTLEKIEKYQADVFGKAFGLNPLVFYAHYNVNEMAFQADMIPHDTSLKTERTSFDDIWVEKSHHFSPQKITQSSKGLRLVFSIEQFQDDFGYATLRSGRYLWRSLHFPLNKPNDIATALKWVRTSYPTLPIHEIILVAHGLEGSLFFDNKDALTVDTAESYLAPAAQHLGPQDDGLVIWLNSCLIARDQGKLNKAIADALLKNVPHAHVLSSDMAYLANLTMTSYPSGAQYRYLQNSTQGNLFIFPKGERRIFVKKPIRYYFETDRDLASYMHKTKKKPPSYFKKISL